MPRWVPNLISTVRIALVPLFIVVAYQGQAAVADGASGSTVRVLAMVILMVIGLSDIVDGRIARAYQLESQTGAVLDAFADKLAQVGILGFFTLAGGPPFTPVPIWLLVLVLGRDLVLGGGWLASVLVGRSIHVVHRSHGRMSSTLMFALLAAITLGSAPSLVFSLSIVVAVIVAVSTVQYTREGVTRLSGRQPRA